MYHYDGGLKITSIDLAIDICRRQARGFISHGHADHMAPHELALCTPLTARLYQRRFGPRLVRELPFDTPLEWDDVRLTTTPAGHMLGSAMLKVESASGSLLYTGDFRLGSSRTAEPARLPSADTLVMESTFGDPRYRWAPRADLEARLLSVVRQAIEVERTPVIRAYVVGKSQEVTRILSDAGLRVRQHPLIAQVSALYEAAGCRVGAAEEYDGRAEPGDVLVMPPAGQRTARLPLPTPVTTIAVTGWAATERSKFSLGVDYAVPLSDHADYDELIECVRQVAPRVVLCTHGPVEFVERLRTLGFDARRLETASSGPVATPRRR